MHLISIYLPFFNTFFFLCRAEMHFVSANKAIYFVGNEKVPCRLLSPSITIVTVLNTRPNCVVSNNFQETKQQKNGRVFILVLTNFSCNSMHSRSKFRFFSFCVNINMFVFNFYVIFFLFLQRAALMHWAWSQER